MTTLQTPEIESDALLLPQLKSEPVLASKRRGSKRIKVLVLFGTRPEVIKLAPVVHQLKAERQKFNTVVVSSGQHADLIKPFVELFRLRINHDLGVMTADQTPNSVCARVLTAFDEILEKEKPDIVLVQGDTTTALAGAMAAFHRKIAVGHVEAGLRSGSANNPFPEEMNRRPISQIAAFHFAATRFNRETLINEGINARRIFVTGNPVVDALQFVTRKTPKRTETAKLLDETQNLKRILLTTHRRESFGGTMRENLRVLRDFIRKHPDTALFFPVHPNPSVRRAVTSVFKNNSRIYLLEPLAYTDFVRVMANSWLIVSDSGGVQEEAPTLGKPLLVLRSNTERPEALASGVAKLVGGAPEKLAALLEENYSSDNWTNSVKQIENPFGDGTAARKIVEILSSASQRMPVEISSN
ncbi:MAG TPA: UDP-N-acetylglucosamine 2-epimerase (non-hydrolyzing) [Pyrinomonadaceae bacterium]|nr:UDP-N-acetylglucosamine 2-epimerase (non-hydrolyzing) [Pyrinomonadaceae bacterium]